MYTYDAILVIRKDGELYAIADNPKADVNFVTKEGLLQERWHESANEDIKEDGNYYVEVGYGSWGCNYYYTYQIKDKAIVSLETIRLEHEGVAKHIEQTQEGIRTHLPEYLKNFQKNNRTGIDIRGIV